MQSKRVFPRIFVVIAMMAMAPVIVGSGASARVNGSDAGDFRLLYIQPILGPLAYCLTILSEDAGWLELRYRSDLLSCSKAAMNSQLLRQLISEGRHQYRLVPFGTYLLMGQRLLVGPAPAYSPGFTKCVPGGSKTLLFADTGNLGVLPGELMSDRRDAPIDVALIFGHEATHGASCSVSELESNTRAVEVENSLRIQADPHGPLRVFHTSPYANARKK